MGMDVIAYTANPRPTPDSKKDHGFIVPGTGDPDGSIPSAWLVCRSYSFPIRTAFEVPRHISGAVTCLCFLLSLQIYPATLVS